MDNIEEIIDADVREDFINDICQYKVGDVVWVITEKRFGIIEDRTLLKVLLLLFIVFVLLPVLS
jgi:hypothetical protein